jgi:hypothetical protein
VNLVLDGMQQRKVATSAQIVEVVLINTVHSHPSQLVLYAVVHLSTNHYVNQSVNQSINQS